MGDAKVKETIILQLEELILHGFVLPGEQLPSERDLAAQLGVSRPLIHDALLVLSARGLITLRPRHGCVVKDLRTDASINSLDSLYRFDSGVMAEEIDQGLEELRSLVLGRSVSRCIDRREGLGPFIERLSQVAHIPLGTSLEKIIEQDFEFYRRIIEFSSNIVFLLLFNSGRALYHEKLSSFFSAYPHALVRVNELKKSLIEAIGSSDKATALTLIEELASYKTYKEG